MLENQHANAAAPLVGLIAGWGRYPIVVANILQHVEVYLFELTFLLLERAGHGKRAGATVTNGGSEATTTDNR